MTERLDIYGIVATQLGDRYKVFSLAIDGPHQPLSHLRLRIAERLGIDPNSPYAEQLLVWRIDEDVSEDDSRLLHGNTSDPEALFELTRLPESVRTVGTWIPKALGTSNTLHVLVQLPSVPATTDAFDFATELEALPPAYSETPRVHTLVPSRDTKNPAPRDPDIDAHYPVPVLATRVSSRAASMKPASATSSSSARMGSTCTPSDELNNSKRAAAASSASTPPVEREESYGTIMGRLDNPPPLVPITAFPKRSDPAHSAGKTSDGLGDFHDDAHVRSRRRKLLGWGLLVVLLVAAVIGAVAGVVVSKNHKASPDETPTPSVFPSTTSATTRASATTTASAPPAAATPSDARILILPEVDFLSSPVVGTPKNVGSA
ncbi:hypothetical protein HKX48_001798 [Thoreauomyces humboldtii]|nr:hypothetical protein HKX48_001798 [Thoreauomyces humboldtii]